MFHMVHSGTDQSCWYDTVPKAYAQRVCKGLAQLGMLSCVAIAWHASTWNITPDYFRIFRCSWCFGSLQLWWFWSRWWQSGSCNSDMPNQRWEERNSLHSSIPSYLPIVRELTIGCASWPSDVVRFEVWLLLVGQYTCLRLPLTFLVEASATMWVIIEYMDAHYLYPTCVIVWDTVISTECGERIH